MSYTALYRKYRPFNFANVVGQDMVVNVLRNAIKLNHISHAYLFTGPRGTGKTSIAKIFAHAVNCMDFEEDICEKCESCQFLKENDTDIIEIDAASNNGVEEIRTLRDNVKLLPTFCKYKIYIIDEVHMLSTGAFNALLKTLEEPPSHVIFILATTEPHKIPLTILSRCQRFDFNKIDFESMNKRLNFILKAENIKLSDEVVSYISKITDGGLRDAINLLDQAISLKDDNITVNDIDRLSGKVSKTKIFEIFESMIKNDYIKLLEIVKELSKNGKSYSIIVNNMLIVVRDLSLSKQVYGYFDEEYSALLSKINFDSSTIIELSKIINELLNEIKNSIDQKLLFEIYILNMAEVINNGPGSYKQDINNKEKSNNNDKDNLKNVNISENKVIEEKIDEDEKQEIVEVNNNLDNEKNEDIDFNDFKHIRINNVLYGANKEVLNSVLGDYDKINDFISNKNYNSIAALLIDGQVRVASTDYLLFSFKDSSYVNLFDLNFKQIELFLKEIYTVSYKVVAVEDSEWEKIKKEFIFNKKNNISYIFMEENDVKLNKCDELSELENSALNIFGDDTISVR